MSYQVTCTFDLKGADSDDYVNAYADLKMIGLERVVAGSKRSVVMPTTMTLGEFDGQSAVAVRDSIRERIRIAFERRRFRSEIFVTVGKDGTWGAGTT